MNGGSITGSLTERAFSNKNVPETPESFYKGRMHSSRANNDLASQHPRQNSMGSRRDLQNNDSQSKAGHFIPPQRTFSPAQSNQSGTRLHQNAAIYQKRKELLQSENEKQIQSTLKEKPTINKRSINLLNLKQQLRER